MEYSTKVQMISRECLYPNHFCDGTTNISIPKNAKTPARVPCPRYHNCPIRRQSVYDEGGKISQ